MNFPTNITVSCQSERSQSQNKETALKILKNKLFQLQQQQQLEKIEEVRGEVLQAAWGNQIVSYVLHPYKLVKDHLTKWESKDPDSVLDGGLDDLIIAYLKWKKGNTPSST